MPHQTKPHEDPQQKRIIEFDWFVRDLEPGEEEQVHGGGGGSTNPSETEDAAN